jgi:hypothetical protein
MKNIFNKSVDKGTGLIYTKYRNLINQTNGGNNMLGLTKEDMKRIDKEAVNKMISDYKRRLANGWSLPSYMQKEIEEDIKELEQLL